MYAASCALPKPESEISYQTALSQKGDRLRCAQSASREDVLMANAALFIGWGKVVQGREAKSLEVFGEGLEYWTRLQQLGEIESFEPVALEPHGGDLGGFVLI